MKRPYKLIIDPGHGGKDPGAVNKNLGLKEKDITMKVGRYLLGISLVGDYLFDPIMTRVSDLALSLKNRCVFANRVEADAFVSIHHNARLTQKPGLEIETYCNPGSIKGHNFASIVQADLMNDMAKVIKTLDRGVKQKAFYVLRKTKMPAILVELGFITDDEEARFLMEDNNLKYMALSIADSTELFLEGGGI